jgi:hypothetical protein
MTRVEPTGEPLRRAGVMGLPAGRRLAWTMAAGQRGRRWRAAVTGADGHLAEALLVETDAAGALSRLELTTAAGILTLHPAGTPLRLHGNVVRPGGVEPLAFDWSPAHALFAGASPITAAIAAAGPAAVAGVGEGRTVAAVEIGPGLVVRAATWRVAHTGVDRWRMLAADGGASLLLVLDPDGLPTGDDAASWPLEESAEESAAQ